MNTSLLQDLCVKVDSTEGIVQLVTGIQQEEERIVKTIKERTLKEYTQTVEHRMQVC